MNAWKKRKLWLSLAAVAAVIAVCSLVICLPFRVMYPDFSGDGVYRLSDASKQYLRGITEDVEIVYYSKGGKLHADQGLYGFVRRMASENPHISVRLEDPQKTNSDAADQSIEIRSAKRAKTLLTSDLVYYYNAYSGAMGIEEYASVLTQMSGITDAETYQSYLSVYGPAMMMACNGADMRLTSAVRTVLADRVPALYAYGTGTYAINSLLRTQLEQSGYSVTALNGLESVPDDCEGLYLEAATDLTASEAAALSAYLEKGGKLFLTTSFGTAEMPNLFGVLSSYGLSLLGTQNYLCVLNASGSSSSPQIAVQFETVEGTHPITQGISGTAASYAHRIVLEQTEGVTHTSLLQTPNGAYCVTYGQDPEMGSFPIGVLAERGESSVVWLSMLMDSASNNPSSGANFALVKQSFDYLTEFDGTALKGISDTPIPSTYLAASNGAIVFWLLAFVLAVPAAVFTVGAVRRYLQRSRGSASRSV